MWAEELCILLYQNEWARPLYIDSRELTMSALKSHFRSWAFKWLPTVVVNNEPYKVNWKPNWPSFERLANGKCTIASMRTVKFFFISGAFERLVYGEQTVNYVHPSIQIFIWMASKWLVNGQHWPLLESFSNHLSFHQSSINSSNGWSFVVWLSWNLVGMSTTRRFLLWMLETKFWTIVFCDEAHWK